MAFRNDVQLGHSYSHHKERTVFAKQELAILASGHHLREWSVYE